MEEGDSDYFFGRTRETVEVHFAALPSLNKALVMELARSEYVERRENIIAVAWRDCNGQ